MKFGIDSETNIEGTSSPVLKPKKYIGAELKKVELIEGSKDDGTPLVKKIGFLFETAEKEQYLHLEYDIADDAKDAEKKAANMSKRVSHIMSKFIDKSILSAAKHDSFIAYANWVIAMLTGKTVGKKLDFIVVGNVYNNKATAGFPGYIPFVVESGKTLAFDNNHLESNAKYFAHMAAQSGDADVEDTTSGAPADTDF